MSTKNPGINPEHYDFLDLDQNNQIMACYVWIDGSGIGLRSKSRTLPFKEGGYKPEELPIWNFDGSSTGQAPGDDSEILLYPVAIFRDPFRRDPNILVMSTCHFPDGTPVETNNRTHAKDVFDKVLEEETWWGLEQEYTMFSLHKWPLGWPKNGFPGPQGPFYCSAGADVAFGRVITEAHYKACLYAGVKISGINAEVMPGQWEFQVGPCEGISIGDHLWIARFILLRVAEIYNVIISYDPKPIPGDWNGAGCHTNFSTKKMRSDGGYEHIIKAIEKLGKKHFEHIAVYGSGNERRLTGRHETASIDKFSYGVADRGASIRIPRSTEADKKGYFEDRRPASNIDPYIVASKIVETVLLDP